MIVAAATLLSAIGGRPTLAQYRETFEGPETSWQLADHDCQVRVLRHARTYDQAREGLASEHLRFQVGSGTYAHWSHAVPRAMVIDELQISLWVKSNRANLPFSARVVLPRAKDPRTGGPLTTLIHGTAYRQAGVWEKLTIQTPTRLLAQQVPLLRSEFGSDVDAREAYIDRLVLNAYGGPGVTDVWIDDLELVGHVSMDAPSPGAASPPVPAPGGMASTASSAGPEHGAQMAGSVLLVAGRPRLARVIEHQGESLAWLKSLGFNAVRLATPPSAEQLCEARECDLWLMAPPPIGQTWPEEGASAERVLAWDLGDHLRANHLESTRAVARQLRSVPEAARRPLICLPREETWQYSRIADLVLLEPPGPNGSLPLGEFGPWYLQRSRLTRPGTPFWAAIRTELSPEITRQARAMGARSDASWSLEPEQIRCLVYHAVASGARGLVFRSQSRLDTSDPLTLLRARTLEWLNHDLQLLEPWAATGSHAGELDAGDPTVRASVLQTDRSRMVLVIRRAADQQYVAGPLQDGKVSLEVPGVPETDEIYQLGESGLKRISRPRGIGARIQLDAPRGISLVVLTQDPLVINFLARQIHDTRRRRDEILGEIASQLYTAVVDTHQRLLESAPPANLAGHALNHRPLTQARTELQHFERLVEGGGHEHAYAFWERGVAELAAMRLQDWRSAVATFPTPVASPLCVSYFLLPEHYAFSQRLRGGAWGANGLPGGDFENLALLQSSGWKNLSVPSAELTTGVELSLHAPHSGRASLRMQCWPVNPLEAPQVIESSPVSIVTAPLPVRRGDVVRIHGWVRVPRAIQGSLHGLMVFDSLAGECLALRVRESVAWREFVLYRAAVRDEDVSVTFALSGMGEAWLDDVTMTVLQAVGPAATLPAEPTWGDRRKGDSVPLAR